MAERERGETKQTNKQTKNNNNNTEKYCLCFNEDFLTFYIYLSFNPHANSAGYAWVSFGPGLHSHGKGQTLDTPR